ncbi:MAG: hypothetical protein KF760_08950 [Candidatus Eremiobacteraeota bacterium]|nr:hypothetical protein [Candidatus Eremiobacteraeota bacterium]MCW5869055.1 hypothetical protein [Candidatus Eremiobacteraeota bacterium]
MLRTSHELRAIEGETPILEVAGYYEQMALLLEVLTQDLMDHQFDRIDRYFSELNRYMFLVEFTLGP